MSDYAVPYAAVAMGVRLPVRVIQRANRNVVGRVTHGAEGCPALQLRLAASPVEGKANRALIAFLAEAPGVRKADIQSGKTGQLKAPHLAGDSAALTARLSAWIDGTQR